jgi:hypothetical protein
MRSFLDYKSCPMAFRASRLQLLPSRSHFGFMGLSFQGSRNWVWEDLFRPFLRVHRATPTKTISEPDLCVMRNKGIEMKVAYHSPDTIRIRVHAAKSDWLFLGPAGTHHNFGGILEQDFLIYWGFSRMQTLCDDHELLAKTEGAAAVFLSARAAIVSDGSGYKIKLAKGLNDFALSVGYEAEISELRGHAATALGEDIERLITRNRADWRKILAAAPLPVGAKLQPKALEAVWTIEACGILPEGRLSRRGLCSSPTGYDKAQWLWDTCFAVRGYARRDPELCKDWLRIFIDNQDACGRFPGLIDIDKAAKEPQVPLFSWAANAVFEADGDQDFLAEACGAAVKNSDWWMSCGDTACGGLPATGPIAYDNSPLYDVCRIAGMDADNPLVNPDIIAALVNDCDEIAAMAQTLGDAKLKKSMGQRRKFLAEEGHKRLWNATDRFYYSALRGNHIPLRIGPALAAIVFAPPDIAKYLARTYIRPGSPAWPARGIATVHADQAAYDPDNFWRGCIWGPTNRLIVDALDRAGLTKSADLLADETLGLMAATKNFYEVYNAETGRGYRATMMAGFGAGVFLDLIQRKLKSKAKARATRS